MQVQKDQVAVDELLQANPAQPLSVPIWLKWALKTVRISRN